MTVHPLNEPWRDVVGRSLALQSEIDAMGCGRPDKAPAKTKRGTSNGNSSGNAEDRRRRRAWLVETYRADVDVYDGIPRWDRPIQDRFGVLTVPLGEGLPACRCFRCGKLLTLETLTVDRIIPGCQGGTYRRNNIRPECSDCASRRGGATRGNSKAAR
jgi:5-methylcytosine-specific restriction endonuclease McrA